MNLLWVLTQKYKFESNSQQAKMWHFYGWHCEFSHKNTNLKAIHNDENANKVKGLIVSSHTKIQIWKQFTTKFWNEFSAMLLWVLTQKYKFESNSQHNFWNSEIKANCEFSHKNTNLKAIHNYILFIDTVCCIVSSHTKIQIWKQFTTVVD